MNGTMLFEYTVCMKFTVKLGRHNFLSLFNTDYIVHTCGVVNFIAIIVLLLRVVMLHQEARFVASNRCSEVIK